MNFGIGLFNLWLSYCLHFRRALFLSLTVLSFGLLLHLFNGLFWFSLFGLNLLNSFNFNFWNNLWLILRLFGLLSGLGNSLHFSTASRLDLLNLLNLFWKNGLNDFGNFLVCHCIILNSLVGFLWWLLFGFWLYFWLVFAFCFVVLIASFW